MRNVSRALIYWRQRQLEISLTRARNRGAKLLSVAITRLYTSPPFPHTSVQVCNGYNEAAAVCFKYIRRCVRDVARCGARGV